jgi:hypothetical protein
LFEEFVPQLDKVTFVSQVFWLILVLVTLYLCMLHFILPYIARTLKFRKRLVDTYLYENLKFNDIATSAIDEYKSVLYKSLSFSDILASSYLSKKKNYFAKYNQYIISENQEFNTVFSEQLISIYIKKSLLLELKKKFEEEQLSSSNSENFNR